MSPTTSNPKFDEKFPAVFSDVNYTVFDGDFSDLLEKYLKLLYKTGAKEYDAEWQKTYVSFLELHAKCIRKAPSSHVLEAWILDGGSSEARVAYFKDPEAARERASEKTPLKDLSMRSRSVYAILTKSTWGL